MCCSTAVRGVDVDQTLVSFSADLAWARARGARIERFNLAQQPHAVADYASVKAELETAGQARLPLMLVAGRQGLAGRYPRRNEQAQWLDDTEPCLFTPQVTQRVVIGASIACDCEPCFKYHLDAARQLGVSAQHMQRAVELAQKVKHTRARALLDIAQRWLQPAAAAAGETRTASAASQGCCAPAQPTQPAPPTQGSCC